MRRLLDGTTNTVGYARMIVDRGRWHTFLKPPRAIAAGEHMATYLLCERGFVPTITLVVEARDREARALQREPCAQRKTPISPSACSSTVSAS